MGSWTDVRDAFRASGLRLVLAGAVAANRYRTRPRATADVDFVGEYAPEVVEVLESQGWEVHLVGDPREPHLVRLSQGRMKVDVLVAETPYQRVAIERAWNDVLTPEDVIVHKLIAGRPEDVDDIRSILDAGVPIDRGYVEEWADRWDVRARWDELATDGRTG